MRIEVCPIYIFPAVERTPNTHQRTVLGVLQSSLIVTLIATNADDLLSRKIYACWLAYELHPAVLAIVDAGLFLALQTYVTPLAVHALLRLIEYSLTSHAYR